MQELRLFCSGFPDEFVFENLTCQVVPEVAAVALVRSSEQGLDRSVVVWHLYSEAAILERVVCPQLLADPAEHRLAQPFGVPGRVCCVAACEVAVSSSDAPGAFSSCA